MQKDTSKIVEELGLCPDFQTFYQENKDYMISGDLSALFVQQAQLNGFVPTGDHRERPGV